MVMLQNLGYESRFDVFTSNQPFLNYFGFLSAKWDLLSFSVSRKTEEIIELLFA